MRRGHRHFRLGRGHEVERPGLEVVGFGSVAAPTVVVVATVDLVVGVGLGFLRFTVVREAIGQR